MQANADQGGTPPALFILGAPRSGTSWLYKLLCLHSGAAWVSNYVRRVPWAPGLAVLNRLAHSVPRRRANAWFPEGEAYVYGQRRTLINRVIPAPVEGEPLFARAGAVAGAGPAMDAAALRRALRTLVGASGGELFVSKRIGHNQRVPELRRAFPDARFVHLVRDGRDVATSLVRVHWWLRERLWWLDGATVAEWLTRGADQYELAARHWLAEVSAVQRGLDEVDPPSVTTVRYEDLTEGGLPVLEKLLCFAPLPPTDRWRSDVGAVLARSRRREPPGRPPLPDVLLDVQAPELVRLGYEL